jgi:hypothetical protein
MTLLTPQEQAENRRDIIPPLEDSNPQGQRGIWTV